MQRLMQAVLLCRYHVLVLTETWLDGSIDVAELQLRDYNVFRKDRSDLTSCKCRGGGVLIAVHRSLHSQEIGLVSVNIEQLFVRVRVGYDDVIIGGVYIPPNAPMNVYEDHCVTMDEVLSKYPENCVYLWGDYNLPCVAWSNFNNNGFVGSGRSPSVQVLCNALSFHNLQQVNNIRNCNDVLLDLLLSNDHTVRVLLADEILLPLDQHHPALVSVIRASSGPQILQYDSLFYDFKRGNLDGLNDFLAGVEWDVVLGPISDLAFMLDRFYGVLYSGIDQFVPISRLKTPKFPRWYDNELKSLIIEKKRAHKKYKVTKQFSDYLAFSRLREQCRISSERCFQNFVHETENSMPGNMKSFWNFVNAKRTDNGLPRSVFLGGSEGSSPIEIASLFSRHFGSVYRPDVLDSPPVSVADTVTVLNDCYIDLKTVYDFLCSLKVDGAPGPDGIPPLLLHVCRCSLAKPLLILFTSSLKYGIFPDRWKQSYITPIYKKGNKSNVVNYRPISILSAIPKLFENIITDQIKRRVTSGLIQQQHGFCNGRSTTTNLMCFAQSVSDALEGHLQVDAVYTDFSKAFDTVSIRLLCAKLSTFGFGGCLLRWLESYLTGRLQAVRIKGSLSEYFAATSGVPQGSHLGPLLFNIFINDVATYVKCPFLLFADDCKIYKVVGSISDCHQLQDCLDSFSVWCRTNSMSLNIDKCQVMSFYRTNSPVVFSYCINGQILRSVDKIRDLGVIFDHKLTFHYHYDYIINKSSGTLGFVCRAARGFYNVRTLILLYQTLVRPVLEYCSPVWSPYYDSHIHSIEMVQNRLLRFISHRLHIPQSSYSATALRSVVRLPRLSTRRSNAELIILYKIINSVIDCPALLSQINFFVPPRKSRRHYTFLQSNHKLNYAVYSPIARLHAVGNLTDIDFFNIALNGLVRLLRESSFVDSLTFLGEGC